jgi:formylglycine-generating enzyme required for sulfatase activity
VAWYFSNSYRKTHQVGKMKANAWGLHDMLGNVWEWCADWYGETLHGGTDPSGPPSGVGRVIRGGSWDSSTCECCVTSRNARYPDDRSYSLGFRPVIVTFEKQDK